jgi:acyl-homoserine lactone acylase PvdQ
MPHLGFAGLPLLDGRFSRAMPLPGGPESLFVNDVSLQEGPTFTTSYHNSGYQAVYDLSDLDASVFIVPGGSSGHFRSPFYDNLSAGWIAGERIRLFPGQISPIATLRLSPAASGR